MFSHLTNVDRPTLGPGVVPSVDRVGNTQSPCLHGICHLQRERGVLRPPGVMGVVRGGPGPRGHEVANSQRHWGTSLPGEEHQNQEVTGGSAGLGEGGAGWGWRALRQSTHLNHRLAGRPPNSCLPAFTPAPAYVQGESMPASSSKSSCPRLPCS